VACWSAKGGAGTTVVAAALARRFAAEQPRGALLVDTAGDSLAALGMP
jgi:anion-transporting  ArsA/GET3 family ATPase